MQSDQRLRQAIVVADQAAEARHPAKAAFHHLLTRESTKTRLAIGSVALLTHHTWRRTLRSGRPTASSPSWT
jgi:hypothetical protein